jgi:predicted metal-dependent hydrolase
MSDQLQPGIDLFNQGDFYECHDTIEEIWLQESSDRQPFLQGLIQAAVSFHHYEHGKWGAARSMLQMAIDKLSPFPDTYDGLETGRLLIALRSWKAALDMALQEPVRPDRIELPYPVIQTVDR